MAERLVGLIGQGSKVRRQALLLDGHAVHPHAHLDPYDVAAAEGVGLDGEDGVADPQIGPARERLQRRRDPALLRGRGRRGRVLPARAPQACGARRRRRLVGRAGLEPPGGIRRRAADAALPAFEDVMLRPLRRKARGALEADLGLGGRRGREARVVLGLGHDRAAHDIARRRIADTVLVVGNAARILGRQAQVEGRAAHRPQVDPQLVGEAPGVQAGRAQEPQAQVDRLGPGCGGVRRLVAGGRGGQDGLHVALHAVADLVVLDPLQIVRQGPRGAAQGLDLLLQAKRRLHAPHPAGELLA